EEKLRGTFGLPPVRLHGMSRFAFSGRLSHERRLNRPAYLLETGLPQDDRALAAFDLHPPVDSPQTDRLCLRRHLFYQTVGNDQIKRTATPSLRRLWRCFLRLLLQADGPAG